MRRNYLEGKHLKEWTSSHQHRVLDADYSSEFYSYLRSLPWAGSHIDWRNLSYEETEIPNLVNSDYIALCKKTPWGMYEYIFIMYAPDEQALLCKTDDAIADLDLLYSAAPGTRFLCGAEIEKKIIRVFHSDFAEYDGFSKLTYLKQ